MSSGEIFVTVVRLAVTLVIAHAAMHANEGSIQRGKRTSSR